MKKLLRSTFGTLLVAAFLAITPPMYAGGGHGGGHGKHRGGDGGKHAVAAHVKGKQAGFRVRGGRGNHFIGHARRAGRAYYATRGSHWGGRGHWGGSGYWSGSYWYPYYGYSRFGYYGLGYSYPYYGYYGYPYYGYYPYRYGYWPYWGLSFGVTLY